MVKFKFNDLLGIMSTFCAGRENRANHKGLKGISYYEMLCQPIKLLEMLCQPIKFDYEMLCQPIKFDYEMVCQPIKFD